MKHRWGRLSSGADIAEIEEAQVQGTRASFFEDLIQLEPAAVPFGG